MIRLEDVHKAFDGNRVLRGVEIEVDDGETLVILGRSGTGKSVTLKHIVGLIRPDRGRILVDGVDVTKARAAELRDVRREVAYLFQTGALVNWMTVRENVALPLVERRDMPKEEIRERVDESLQSLGMLEAAERFPAAISGGMRKRAALARVLVQEPRAILYDEPTAGLDPIMSRNVGRLIREVQASAERTAIVVTHDLILALEDLAALHAVRVALHHEGRLVEVADPQTFQKSSHPVIRAFLDRKDTLVPENGP